MPKSCRPGDWFGTITVVETKLLGHDDSVPATDEFNKGTESISNSTTTRTGTIWFNGNSSPFSSWQEVVKLTSTKVHNGMVDCDFSHKIQLVPVKSGTHREIKLSGSVSLSMEIYPGLSEDGRKFNIAFQIPAVDVSGKGKETNTVAGGCPGMAFPPRESDIGETYTESPEDVQFEGSIFPGDPEKISGSEPIDRIPPGLSIPRWNATHTVLVTYKLYKFH